MTELSYTAWDDNSYQWPPPDGWYQASDGKWWPEGYGPVTDQSSGETSTDSSAEAADEAADTESASFESAADDVESGEQESLTEVPAEEDEMVEEPDRERVTTEFESGYNGTIAEGLESSDDVTTEAVAEEFDEDVETMSETAANGTSEFAAAVEPESDYEVELDDVASGFADTSDTAHPTESHVDAESRYSTSSAGMAASGFAPRAEGGSSSLGLAGWAQTEASEVRNRVDISHEYDYTPPDDEVDDLLDPIEVSDDDHDIVPSPLDTSALDTAALDTSAVKEVATSGPTVDAPVDPVDSTLSRLDDLKRQVEQQSFTNHLGGADTTRPVSDLDVGGFDPTETLDIDPNDLTLESNPYYGGTDETGTYGATPGVGVEDPVATNAYNGDYGATAEVDVDYGHDERSEAESEGYGFTPVGEATIDAPSAAETRQYGYEGDPPGPVGEPVGVGGAGFGVPQTDYSGAPTLSPMSSPPPKAGRGRTFLYALIVLLALAVAGVAGYLFFQLQSDDGSGGDAAATATVGGGDAGPSDLSGQEPGSFSSPHELAGGVRLTVPVGDEGTEVWMLQVREPATASDLGDERVEVISRVRVRNDSADGDLSASGLRFVLVSADGSTGTTAAAACSSGDDLNRQEAIEPGKDIEGNVCWTVPGSQATGALLGIESVHAGGRVHVQLS